MFIHWRVVVTSSIHRTYPANLLTMQVIYGLMIFLWLFYPIQIIAELIPGIDWIAAVVILNKNLRLWSEYIYQTSLKVVINGFIY